MSLISGSTTGAGAARREAQVERVSGRFGQQSQAISQIPCHQYAINGKLLQLIRGLLLLSFTGEHAESIVDFRF
ncbi:MAG: hypothetical protein HYR71_00935 [Chloroflexi bacterium]|nr:hypothetical protein [Chloroflexota bacterium]